MGGHKAKARDPLLHWRFREIASREQGHGKKVVFVRNAISTPAKWSVDAVPDELRPVVEEQTVLELIRCVSRDPWLYWHPLVRDQVRALQHFTRGNAFLIAEKDLVDKETEKLWTSARKLCRELIEAHANGLLVGEQVEWKELSEKPGPKPILADRSPEGRKRRNKLSSRQLYEEVSQLDFFLGIFFGDAIKVPKEPDPAYREAFKKKVERAVLWASTVPSADVHPNLTPAMDQFLTWATRSGKRKDGRHRYLAYCVLSVLLGQPASIIRGKVSNFRKSLDQS